MRRLRIARSWGAALVLMLALASCDLVPPVPPPTSTASPSPVATPSATREPPAALPAAVEYDLGEATIVQERFPADSRFRNMPVRLNGVIAVPETTGPHPVVVILHGNHPGCPVDDMGVDRWPCAPTVEQPNYRGFAYLVRELAGQGYVALSININAENTFGFGEPTAGERLQQIVDLHLQALAEATAGRSNEFGVELAGRADLSRMALFGHSRGGEAAVALANSPEVMTASRGYGPVAGVLLIAAAVTTIDPWNGSAVPLAAILSACDGDVVTQDGQFFYEGARLSPQQTEWATSAWLERANHNSFNQMLPRDPFGLMGRPDCDLLLADQEQQKWLVDYAADFLTTLFSKDAQAVAAATTRLGMDATGAAPDELYGLPGRATFLPAAANRQVLFRPAAAEELETNLLGGAVTTDRADVSFCPKGFYSSQSLPGSEACRRNYVTIPGQPSHAVVSWSKRGAELRFDVPEGAGNLSGYTSLSMRAAVDPVSTLNAGVKPQAFTIRLTDGTGKSARASTRVDEPALVFPPGFVEPLGDGDRVFFTGPVPLTTIRLPLSAFAGIDLSDVREVALVFDRMTSGTLFFSDVEWVRQ